MAAYGATRNVATVFGGSGFIGRYIVKRLAQLGYVVRAAVRDPEAALFLKPMGAVGQVVPLYASLDSEPTVARAVEGASVVINAVGILAERRPGDFGRIQADGAGRVARLAAAAGVARLVHISAIGADTASPSGYASSKGNGEQAVRAAFPTAVILRPSVVFGPEDQFFNRFATMAQFLPFLPVISGETKLQPVYVGDVADAALTVLHDQTANGKTFELGGPRVWTLREVMQYVLHETRRDRKLMTISPGMARFQASILERVPGKPLTRDQLLLLAQDNVISQDAPGLADLGIIPSPVELVAPSYLRRYRPGGGKRDILPDELNGTKPDLSA